MSDNTKPKYYKRAVKGVELDVFDIGVAYELNPINFSALKYLLRFDKPNNERRKDLMKAMECIDRELTRLDAEELGQGDYK